MEQETSDLRQSTTGVAHRALNTTTSRKLRRVPPAMRRVVLYGWQLVRDEKSCSVETFGPELWRAQCH